MSILQNLLDLTSVVSCLPLVMRHLISRLRGEELEYRSTAASPFFKNGMGKMYLLR